MPKESVTLYYRSGTSDKIYMAVLEEQGDGYIVTFAFGRRGSTLQTGVKTAAPVPYEEAKKVYDALIRSKTAKGYTPGEDGTPYSQSSNEQRATGILPQLLNPINEHEVERFIRDPNWWMQEKFDGRRLLIRRESGKVTAINRRGLAVGLSSVLEADAQRLDCDYILDGEAIGDTLHAFDLLSAGGDPLKQAPYAERFGQLEIMLRAHDCRLIRPVYTAKTVAQKRCLYEELRKRRAEGVVLKNIDAAYTPGRPASGGDQLKLKFYATASVIVAGVNRRKRSVTIEILADGKRVGIGNVTVPPNHAIPPVDSIIEVRFLYAYPGGSLYQPVFLSRRDDIELSACHIGQLKYKAESEDDETP